MRVPAAVTEVITVIIYDLYDIQCLFIFLILILTCMQRLIVRELNLSK